MSSFTIFTWVLTLISIIGTLLNCRGKKIGFVIWGIANTCWIFIDLSRGIWAQAFLYIVFIGFNIYGYRMWSQKENG